MKFSLRALCLLVTILAVCLGFLAASFRQAEHQRTIVRQIEQLGGTVCFRNEYNSGEHSYSRTSSKQLPLFERAGALLFGRQIDWIFLYRNDVPPKLLREIAELKGVKQLSISPSVAESAEIKLLKRGNPACMISAEWNFSNSPITTLTTQPEFEQAITASDSVLFIDGGLSINVSLSRPIFAELAAEWLKKYPKSKVRFLRVDFQRAASPAWLAALQWQLDHGVDEDEIALNGAAGRVLWIRAGNLLRYDSGLRKMTASDVIRHTETAFEVEVVR